MALMSHKFPDRMFIDVEGLPLKALYGVCLKGGKTMAWGRLYGERTSGRLIVRTNQAPVGLRRIWDRTSVEEGQPLEVFIKVKGQNQVFAEVAFRPGFRTTVRRESE